MSDKNQNVEALVPLSKEWLESIPKINNDVTQLSPPLTITSSMLLSNGDLDEICVVQEEVSDENIG